MVVESHLVEVGDPQQLTFRLTGIDQRSQQVEDGGKLQCLSDGTDELHGLGKELCMQIDNARLVQTAVQLIDIIGELDSVIGNHIRCPTGRGGGIVAMLGYFVTGTRQ